MIVDHFFITAYVDGGGLYCLNAIGPGEREAAFKEAVSATILMGELEKQSSSFSGN